MTPRFETGVAAGPDHLLRKAVLKLRWMGLHAEAARLEDECRRLGRADIIPASRTDNARHRAAA